MSFDFLRKISERVVRQWNRYDLNKKFVEMAKELLITKEKNLQLEKNTELLKAEIERLKNQQSKPKFPKPRKRESEVEPPKRDKSKSKKKSEVEIDQTKKLSLNLEDLPSDAKFIGTRSIIIQDIVFERLNTEYIIERFYSPSEGKTYEAEVPNYSGSKYGFNLRSFVNLLYYKGRVPHEKIRSILFDIGSEVSKASLVRILNDQPSELNDELAGARSSALKKGEEVFEDETGHKFNNLNLYTFGVSNAYWTHYSTFGNKSKLSAMKALFNGSLYRYSDYAIAYLKRLKISKKWFTELRPLFSKKYFRELAFDKLLAKLKIAPRIKGFVKQAALWDSYLRGKLGPPIKHLVTDDAPNLNIKRNQQLCWVHEIRKYKLLDIYDDTEALDLILLKFRYFYSDLKSYKQNPSASLKIKLDKLFDQVVTSKTGLTLLDDQLLRTKKNKKRLLYVLKHPTVSINTNQIERDLREKVIKRKISLFNRSIQGVDAWDLMLSLMGTCKKNKVSFYKYLQDRYSQKGEMPYLGQIIAAT